MCPTSRYRFGLYEFDVDSLGLLREGRPVKLQNQPARLLALLIRNAGSTVSKEEMIRHIWGGKIHVDYNEGLSYCIKHLRRALRDDAENPCFVQNVPRRGYRFIAPLEMVGRPAEVATTPGGETSRRERTWIRNAVWFLLILLAILLLYLIYEDFPRS
jgi:DNA-binding winged helix-turn-helix (wHTH) protein